MTERIAAVATLLACVFGAAWAWSANDDTLPFFVFLIGISAWTVGAVWDQAEFGECE